MNTPETLGFLSRVFRLQYMSRPTFHTKTESQTVPFYVRTKDGNELYAWLIAPLGIYARHVEQFRQENLELWSDIRKKQVFKCLSENPESRLVIYCQFTQNVLRTFANFIAVHGVRGLRSL